MGSPSVIGWVATLTCLVTLTLSMPMSEYLKERDGLLQTDRSTRIGHSLTLTDDEKIVSDLMVKEKRTLIENSRQGRQPYYPSYSFYKSKPFMENTTIFKLIKQMPKGAALHLHDLAIGSLDWLVTNATYRDNCYMCIDKFSFMNFKFSKNPPGSDADCTWTSVAAARSSAHNAHDFDLSLKKNMSLLATDPLETYPTITQIWTRFMQYFGQVQGLISYAPVFKDYYKQALKEFSEDNIQYLELRGLFRGVYDFEGTVYTPESILQIYLEATKEFLQENMDFFGAKFIMSGIRSDTEKSIMSEVKMAMDLRQKYPEAVLGYDLVGQEDPNYSLLHYRSELLAPSQMTPSRDLPYFFHAAETNWQGTATDYNLIDAILMNTTRIGHGFGLVKHPSLVAEIKKKGIAVEVNPISNQLLGLVEDPRNHALVPLMADDLPLVISSDDPGCWEAAPLSSDFYVAFMNMCGEDHDLRFLKQLAINSIKYSAMSSQEKDSAMKLWNMQWDKFIKKAAMAISGGN